jgi:three-Cys-motif partner protein
MSNAAATNHGYDLDKIGEWSERKIRIVSKYAQAYSRILAAHRDLKHYYIDGFTGGGHAIRRDTADLVETTARRILAIEPPFVGYHLIDFEPSKADAIKEACKMRPQAISYCGDANKLLPPIFSTIRYKEFKRALCFLDPYKVLLSWNVLVAAGATGTIESFIHFPTGDIQRNVLRHDQSKVAPAEIDRMNAMWGDESWRSAAYLDEPDLFGSRQVKQPIDLLLDAFADRLRKIAGFKHVSTPLPMRNKTNAIIYHLIFATQQRTALRIASDILKAESTPKV